MKNSYIHIINILKYNDEGMKILRYLSDISCIDNITKIENNKNYLLSESNIYCIQIEDYVINDILTSYITNSDKEELLTKYYKLISECLQDNTYPNTIKIILWNKYNTLKKIYGTNNYKTLIINNYLKDIPKPKPKPKPKPEPLTRRSALTGVLNNMFNMFKKKS
jgi:hypothetical protein